MRMGRGRDEVRMGRREEEVGWKSGEDAKSLLVPSTVPSQPKTSTVRCHQDVTNSQEQNKSIWSHKIQRSVLKCTFLRFLTASKS